MSLFDKIASAYNSAVSLVVDTYNTVVSAVSATAEVVTAFVSESARVVGAAALAVTASGFLFIAEAFAADPDPTIGDQVMAAVNLDGLEEDVVQILSFAALVLVGFIAFKIIKRALNKA